MTGSKVKAIYFLLYMGFAIWRIFYNVYLEENDFSGVQIGVINALMQAVLVLILPVWGIIADKRGIRPVLRITVFASAILVAFLGGVLNFWWLIIYVIILTSFTNTLGPLTDALAVEYTKINARYNYGNLRLWGSLGWGLASVFAGIIFMHVPLKYTFPVSAGVFLLSLVFFRIPRKRKIIFRPHFEPIHMKEFSKNYSLLIFLGILFLYGIASAPVNIYINLYFAELKAGNLIIGTAFAIQALSELPFFIIGSFLLRRLGAQKMILLAILFMVIRLFVYGIFPNITIALIVGAMQGITLSFFLVGAVDYIHKQLPHGRNATAQSLLWGLYFGIGHMVGNLIIGILKDHFGMIGVMKYFTFFVLFIFLATMVYFSWKKKNDEVQT